MKICYLNIHIYIYEVMSESSSLGQKVILPLKRLSLLICSDLFESEEHACVSLPVGMKPAGTISLQRNLSQYT